MHIFFLLSSYPFVVDAIKIELNLHKKAIKSFFINNFISLYLFFSTSLNCAFFSCTVRFILTTSTPIILLLRSVLRRVRKINILLNLQVEFITAIFNVFLHVHFLYKIFLFSISHTLGRPQPAVRWLINGEVQDDQYEHNSGDVIENRLLWPQIQRHNLNSIFTCQASNTKLVEPKETSFVLDMYCKLQSSKWILVAGILCFTWTFY